jgi:cell division protein ZapA
VSKEPVAVTVTILDKDYQVACGKGEEESLREAAEYLDGKMREIRDHGRIIGIDRIAVMAALNIAAELLQLKPLEEERHSLARHIASLRETVSHAVSNQPDHSASKTG